MLRRSLSESAIKARGARRYKRKYQAFFPRPRGLQTKKPSRLTPHTLTFVAGGGGGGGGGGNDGNDGGNGGNGGGHDVIQQWGP